MEGDFLGAGYFHRERPAQATSDYPEMGQGVGRNRLPAGGADQPYSIGQGICRYSAHPAEGMASGGVVAAVYLEIASSKYSKSQRHCHFPLSQEQPAQAPSDLRL